MNLAYSFHSQRSYDELADALQASALARGFRTLHVHEVDRTLAEKGFALQRTGIIEVCNAAFAHAVLTRHPDAGMLLPCRILLRDDGGHRSVVLMRPALIAEMMPEADFGEVPAEVERILLDAVRDALGA